MCPQDQSDFPAFATVLKVISYCTVVIPLIVLVAKVCLRYMYHFHEFEDCSRFMGPDCAEKRLPPNPPSGGSSTLPRLDGRVYNASAEEIIPYKIRMTSSLYRIGGDEGESIGFSDLPEYQDSYFLVNVYPSKEDGCRFLVRRLLKERRSIVCERRFDLTPRALEDLEIDWKTVSIDEKGVMTGTSLLAEYKDAAFTWSEERGYIARLTMGTL